jgi:hypothetical protein
MRISEVGGGGAFIYALSWLVPCLARHPHLDTRTLSGSAVHTHRPARIFDASPDGMPQPSSAAGLVRVEPPAAVDDAGPHHPTAGRRYPDRHLLDSCMLGDVGQELIHRTDQRRARPAT